MSQPPAPSEPLQQLPLRARHEALGARFTPFAGYDMPIRYGSIIEEHQAVRQRAGLFDVSHMGEVELVGPHALAAINRIVTNDVNRLADGDALYTVMCHPHGGIVDDLLVYRIAADHILCCVNASNRAKDFAHMRDAAAGECDVRDTSADWCQLAIQGPQAVALVAGVCDADVAALRPFQARFAGLAGVRALVSRTGYTGEDGFEVYVRTHRAERLFDVLWDAGRAYDLKPVGLGARDTLRLEARLMLYGNDLSDDTSPLEAGLGWVVKLDKGDFIGREALAAQKATGLTRRLRGLILAEGGVLRPHYPIYAGDQHVGETTSGGPSPTLGGSIGLGYVAAEHADQPTLDVEVRGRRLSCTVTGKPFYKRAGGGS